MLRILMCAYSLVWVGSMLVCWSNLVILASDGKASFDGAAFVLSAVAASLWYVVDEHVVRLCQG